MSDLEILKRLYHDYTKKYLKNILISIFFTILLAGSTSAVAYLLDPAIKQLFIEQKQSLIYLIPALIVVAFTIKGGSLYLAKVIMIKVSEEVRKDIQVDMFSSLIKADTKLVDNKHSGKFVTNLTNDVGMITNLVSTAILNLFKDSLTLIGLLSVMFYQNWKLSLIAIVMAFYSYSSIANDNPFEFKEEFHNVCGDILISCLEKGLRKEDEVDIIYRDNNSESLAEQRELQSESLTISED